MYKKDEDKKRDGDENRIPVREVHAVHDNKEAGMDSEIIIGDENLSDDILRYADIFRSRFTSYGRFTQTGLSRFLKEAQKKYRIKIKIFLIRRVR